MYLNFGPESAVAPILTKVTKGGGGGGGREGAAVFLVIYIQMMTKLQCLEEKIPVLLEAIMTSASVRIKFLNSYFYENSSI